MFFFVLGVIKYFIDPLRATFNISDISKLDKSPVYVGLRIWDWAFWLKLTKCT